MCFHELLWWARQNGRIQMFPFTTALAWARIVTADPLRWAVMLAESHNANVKWGFGPGQPVSPVWAPANVTGPVVLTEDQIGDLVQAELWTMSEVAGENLTVITISYDPNRRARLDRNVTADFSGTPAP